jgi:hypothetical protein
LSNKKEERLIKRNMAILFFIPILVLIISFFAGCSGYDIEDYPESQDFTTISRGQTSSISDQKHLVIRDEQGLKDIWQQIDDARGLPEIDFENNMVIAVFMGERPTGGYGIEIESIDAYADRITVNIVETEPGPDELTTQALAYPYHIVTTEKTEMEVRFELLE